MIEKLENHKRYYCRTSAEAREAFRELGVEFRETRSSGEFYIKECYCDYYMEVTEDAISSNQIELIVVDGRFKTKT